MLTPMPGAWIGGDAVPAGVGGEFSITQQPANVSVAPGSAATFSVGTSTDVPLCYQWMRGGVDIAGAIDSHYTLYGAAPTDSGAIFSVRVSIPGGKSTVSDPRGA